MQIINQDVSKVNDIIKWITSIDLTTNLKGIPDGIYPFDYLGTDKWTIVIGERQIAWGRDYGIICAIYAEALRVKREHAERCPTDAAIPEAWYNVHNGVDDFSVDRKTGRVTL